MRRSETNDGVEWTFPSGRKIKFAPPMSAEDVASGLDVFAEACKAERFRTFLIELSDVTWDMDDG